MLAVTVERGAPSADGRTAAGLLSATVWQTQKGQRTILATRRVEPGELLHLRLVATDRTRFQFAVSADGRTWDTLSAEAQGGFLPPWDLSVRVALLVSGPPEASARFGAFRLEDASR